MLSARSLPHYWPPRWGWCEISDDVNNLVLKVSADGDLPVVKILSSVFQHSPGAAGVSKAESDKYLSLTINILFWLLISYIDSQYLTLTLNILYWLLISKIDYQYPTFNIWYRLNDRKSVLLILGWPFAPGIPPVRPQLHQCSQLPGDAQETSGVLRVWKGEVRSG